MDLRSSLEFLQVKDEKEDPELCPRVIARRKNIPFYPARTGMNFSYFQLARRSFRFPSQLISQCFFFQLAQILPEERVFCRAAPLGTPEMSCIYNYFYSIEAIKEIY